MVRPVSLSGRKEAQYRRLRALPRLLQPEIRDCPVGATAARVAMPAWR